MYSSCLGFVKTPKFSSSPQLMWLPLVNFATGDDEKGSCGSRGLEYGRWNGMRMDASAECEGSYLYRETTTKQLIRQQARKLRSCYYLLHRHAELQAAPSKPSSLDNIDPTKNYQAHRAIFVRHISCCSTCRPSVLPSCATQRSSSPSRASVTLARRYP